MSASLSTSGTGVTKGYIDEELEAYYKVCEGDSDGSDSSDDDSDDSSPLSPWRAASRGATLCGRASRLTLSHRRTMQQIRDDRDGRGEYSTFGSIVPDAARLATERQPRTQSLVSFLTSDPVAPAFGVPPASTAAATQTSTSPDVACGVAHVYVTPQEAMQRRRDAEHARRSVVLLDILSAVAQQPSRSCVAASSSSSTTKACVWRFRDDVDARLTLPFQGLLRIANMVAEAEAELCAFETITLQSATHWRFDPTREVNGVGERQMVVGDDRGVGSVYEIGLSAFHTLARFARVLRGVLREFKVWLVGEQELLVEQMRVSDNPDSMKTGWVDLIASVETNALTLHRMLVIAQDSHCFCDLQTRVASLIASRACLIDDFADACATAGAALLDFLILRASALQGIGSMDLYRLYMMLLMHCAWPYILLVTSAIFGFVRDVDAPLWRRRLPRLFRASFSHLRLGEDRTRYPTDILSLLLSCVGYSEFDSAAPLRTIHRDDCDDGDRADKSPKHGRTCHEHPPAMTLVVQTTTTALHPPAASATALLSMRRFVVRNADAFARRRRGRGRRACALAHVSSTAALGENAAAANKPRTCVTDFNQSDDDEDDRERRTGTAQVTKDDFLRLLRDTSTTCCGTSALGSCGQVSGIHSARVASHPQPPSDGLTAHYPTHLPLALITVTTSPYLDGDRAGRDGGRVGNDAAAAAERKKERQKEEEGRGDGDVRGGARGVGVWRLQLHTSGVPDIALGCEAWRPAGEVGSRAVPGHTPWLDVTIPAARWITAALLLPIAVVIQRLHQRRLRNLLRGPPSRTCHPASEGASSTDDITDDALLDSAAGQHTARGEAGYALGWLTYQQRRRRTAFGHPMPRAPTAFAFADAVNLLVDVALLRDKERLVHGFLQRLCVEEVHWWYRRDAAELAAVGTTSIAISAAFRDALRGRRYGSLVRLVVLEPAPCLTTTITGDGCGAATVLAREMLDVFASMRLIFAFPPELDLVLRPRSLRWDAEDATGVRGESITCGAAYSSSLFWQRRGAVELRDTTDSGVAPLASESTEDSDVWSYAFGYLCSLHFAQLVLREQHHRLRTQDQQERDLLSVTATATSDTASSSSSSSRRLRYLARSLGSSYYALSFVTGSVLAFTEREVSATLTRIEQLSTRHDRFVSCIDLCRALDRLLVGLWLVCYPVRGGCVAGRSATSLSCRCPHSVAPNISVDVERVRRAINDVLALVLNPTRLPTRMMIAYTSEAAETLVTVLSRLPIGTTLALRLRPLLTLLTFNRFYGEREATIQL